MMKSMTIKKQGDQWIRFQPGSPYSTPIFNNPDIINNFGSDDPEGYDIELGVDGKWYEVNDAQTPMFEPSVDISADNPGNPDGSSLLSGSDWLTEAIESGIDSGGLSVHQPVEEVVMLIMGFARNEKIMGISIEMIDKEFYCVN